MNTTYPKVVPLTGDAGTLPTGTSLRGKSVLLRFSIYLSLFLLMLDTVYKIINGISYLNREKCLLYSTLPRWVFWVYEYFFELLLLVIAAIFAATLLDTYFSRIKKCIPKTAIGTFLYASVIPVCACGVVPMTEAMKKRIPFRAVITFVVAAPLLNPYIIILSFTVLGLRYTLLRIICSFLLALSTGYIVEMFYKRMKNHETKKMEECPMGYGCTKKKGDVYEETFAALKRMLPYVLLAGVLGIVVEALAPNQLLEHIFTTNSALGTFLAIGIGVPIYFCNGADVLFLQPLIQFSSLPLGTAMAFSLTSTSICITSLVLFTKFIGKRLTCVMLSSIVLVTLFLSLCIQCFLN